MPAINQLSVASDLVKGDQLPLAAGGLYGGRYAFKASLNQLTQELLSAGVFDGMSLEYFSVPAVPVASLPDPVEAGVGARAAITDGFEPVFDALLTVAKGAGEIYGFSTTLFGTFGSVNDPFDPLGATIEALVWNATLPNPALQFILQGTYPNEGWDMITLDRRGAYPRDQATSYSTTLYPGYTVWSWETTVTAVGPVTGVLYALYWGPAIAFNSPVVGGGTTTARGVPVFSDGEIWRIG